LGYYIVEGLLDAIAIQINGHLKLELEWRQITQQPQLLHHSRKGDWHWGAAA
jgi:hypothetical protein